jgi:hypothetical protein
MRITSTIVKLASISRYIWFILWPVLVVAMHEWNPFDVNFLVYFLVGLPICVIVERILQAFYVTCLQFQE